MAADRHNGIRSTHIGGRRVDRFGTYRSLEPAGVLPQQAQRLDVGAPLTEDEIALDVEMLNIDSASYAQIREECSADGDRMKERILAIVAERGKLHNPVTGSGGMLVGIVSELGSHRVEPAVGTRVATLVSLTLTPLVLDRIVELDPSSEKVKVEGRAILFGSGIYAEVPNDLSEDVVLGTLDVCGAPAWMARLARPAMRIVVIGAGGKSGMLACAQATRTLQGNGRVLGLCWPEATTVAAKEAGAEAVAVDCTNPLAASDAVTAAFDGQLADLVFVCSNVPGCEGGAVMSCTDEGRIVFFSMATSFTAAALSAEGLGKSCEMTIGNGYVPGHAELALDLVRTEPALAARIGR
jgi:L-erythro-3,5-diaminohexanoate dehydrogenase